MDHTSYVDSGPLATPPIGAKGRYSHIGIDPKRRGYNLLVSSKGSTSVILTDAHSMT